MFDNRNARRERSAATPASAERGRGRGAFSVIGSEVVVTGNITSEADLHIDGRVDGDVRGGHVIQGADSLICGNLAADSARLAGRVEGMVRVKSLLVEAGARIVGDVEYESITIETGGSIDGRMKNSAAEGSAPSGPRALPDLTEEAA